MASLENDLMKLPLASKRIVSRLKSKEKGRLESWNVEEA